MIFYQTGTTIGLIVTSIPAIVGVFLYYTTSHKKTAFTLLVISAFLIRLLMISLDPYLQDWDERFHAIVAKNMMTWPFKPMMVVDPVFAYNYQDWWNSHIWVHKQPLFMWQMALSMKLFGVNTIAMRLPLAIMGTIGIWMIREILRRWTSNEEIAFIAAFLACFAWYGLEMVAGFQSLDHNDFSFYFYILAGTWAWSKYIVSDKQVKWAVITGIFVGCAVLVKWLTAYLVLGGWGVYVLLSPERRGAITSYAHIALAAAVSLLVFGPWQLYIMHRFPLESAWSYHYNVAHFYRDLGHEGPWYYHFMITWFLYQMVLVYLAVMGIIASLICKDYNRQLSWSYLAMILVIYGFFSFVLTRMPGFVYPVSGLVYGMIAIGFFHVLKLPSKLIKSWSVIRLYLAPCLLLFIGFLGLRPLKIIGARNEDNAYRNRKINNTTVYKHLDPELVKNYVIINCPNHEQLELMYHAGGNAYLSYPTEQVLDSLKATGLKFAAFEFNPQYILPDYILNDPDIIKIKDGLQ
ncbi:MAG TPA: glycosyltransferase family 39 protein [Saprospiraceae bacterium]|nr:glycosyltransferase family 39 protein [Saprospiraceae bacterium]